MSVINLTGFPLRFGGPDTEPVPAHGKAVVSYGPTPAVRPLRLEDGREFPATGDGAVTGVTGLTPDAYGPEDILIVPAIVAAAMLELGIQAAGGVYAPGILQERDGVKFATAPKAYPDLAHHWR